MVFLETSGSSVDLDVCRLDSEPDEIDSVVDPNSVDGTVTARGSLVVFLETGESSVDALDVGRGAPVVFLGTSGSSGSGGGRS